jgi:hypothetical protein
VEEKLKSADGPGTEQRQPKQQRAPASPHDAFFKQTFSDERLAGLFLRERLPKDLAALLGSADPILCEAEFVDDDLTKKFADKVLGTPPIAGAKFRLYIVMDGKSEGHRLDIVQATRYCYAILNKWYRRARENRQHQEAQRRPLGPIPVAVPLIVHSGAAKYSYATELAELVSSDHLRPFMLSVKAVLVDLRLIEDNDLSADPVLRVRLRALKHATDADLSDNLEKLDSVLEGVEQLQEPHAQDIIGYLSDVLVGGMDQVQNSLKRIAPKKADKIMVTTAESIREQVREENLEKVRAAVADKARAEAAAAEAKARAEAVAAEAQAEVAEARAGEVKAQAQASEAKAKAEEAETRAAEAEAKAAEAQAQTAETLIAVVEQRIGTLPAEARVRIGSASVATLNGWLGEVTLKNSLDSLLATGQGDGGIHTNRSEGPEA